MSEVNKGIKFLKKNDPFINEIILKKGDFKLKASDTYFRNLISTIIAQQLSWKVYSIIEKRLFKKLNNTFYSKNVLALSDEEYRACGISNSKTNYIKNVAIFYKDHTEFFKNINNLSDDEIIRELTTIKGIGVWSAQMFLIFNLKRLNVFPIKDGGIRAAMKRLYCFKDEPTDKQLLKIAAKWGNYKTIASWYLWRYLESE